MSAHRGQTNKNSLQVKTIRLERHFWKRKLTLAEHTDNAQQQIEHFQKLTQWKNFLSTKQKIQIRALLSVFQEQGAMVSAVAGTSYSQFASTNIAGPDIEYSMWYVFFCLRMIEPHLCVYVCVCV